MGRKGDTLPGGLCCSFCRKSQDSVSKLISNAGDLPRAYICDECITVCVTILDDVGDRPGSAPGVPVHAGEHPLLAHPMTSRLLSAIEHWIRHESLGIDAAPDLGEVRQIALEMMIGQHPERRDP